VTAIAPSVVRTVPPPFVAQIRAEDVMRRSTRRIRLGLAFAATTASVAVPLLAQRGGAMPQEQRDVRWEGEKELQSLAVADPGISATHEHPAAGSW
jgi:hypothetical protein